ncbi:MAG: TldD/PmbA family protein, partial [candidate division Zixibacteria bacterium]|nr:TldD/PmbA family protein [candidate division Zixibacteria bacterium]
MNKKQRLELAEWSVAQARKGGADDVAVNVGNSRDIEIQFREGNLEKLQESTQNYLSLSIYASMRYSSHSTNDIRKESLKGFIEEAIDMTKYLNEDPFRSLPDPKYYKDQKEMDLKIKDIDYDKVTSDSRVSMAREIEKIAMAQSDKIISCTSYYADNYYESVKVHSNGFKGENEGTSFSAGVAVTVKDEKGRPQDYDWRTVRFHKELPAPEVYAKSAVQRTLNQIGQVKLKSGLYDMVIENRENWRIFYSLLEPLTGQALQQKNSFLEGKLGQKIGSEKFTIIDDPFIQSGLSSILYDGEGMAARKRVIVDKGVLESYY